MTVQTRLRLGVLRLQFPVSRSANYLSSSSSSLVDCSFKRFWDFFCSQNFMIYWIATGLILSALMQIFVESQRENRD